MSLYRELIHFIKTIIMEMSKETGNPIDEILEEIKFGLMEKTKE